MDSTMHTFFDKYYFTILAQDDGTYLFQTDQTDQNNPNVSKYSGTVIEFKRGDSLYNPAPEFLALHNQMYDLQRVKARAGYDDLSRESSTATLFDPLAIDVMRKNVHHVWEEEERLNRAG